MRHHSLRVHSASPSTTSTPPLSRVARIALSTRRNFAVAGLLAMHMAPPIALVLGPTTRDWIGFGIMFAIVSFGLTAGFHRYYAHRSFRTSRFFQFVLGLMGALAFGDPVAFSARHRAHHRYSDSDQDIHSPTQGFWKCWLGTLVDYSADEADQLRGVPDLAKYPEVMWLHHYFFVPGFVAVFVAFALGGFTMLAISYCLACVMVIHTACAVNYFCHIGWPRRFRTTDRSANNPLIALISLGEGWHNNHHYYPHACRAGFRWWEIDVLYYQIKLLSWCGVVWDLHEVSDRVRYGVARDRSPILERHANLSLDSPFDDVAKDMLLRMRVGEIRGLHDGRQPTITPAHTKSSVQ